MSRNILAIPGPTILDIDILKAFLVQDVGHLSREFLEVLSRTIKLLRDLVDVGDDYQPIILAGSGTVGMEASLTNFIEKGGRALVISNGYFGDLAYQILHRYPVDVDIIKAGKPGEAVDTKRVLELCEAGNYSIVVATHVDTSTGVRQNIAEIGAELKDTDTVFIVDGVCSVAGEEIYMDDMGIDVLFTGSQKALSTPVGLAVVWLSPKALSKLDEPQLSAHYMDLSRWLRVMKSYEEGSPIYYATPAVNLVYSLNMALQKILDYGLDRWYKKHRIMAKAFRDSIRSIGLETMAREEVSASTVTAVYLPDNISSREFRREMSNRGVYVAGGILEGLRDKYFRVGHMGMMNLNDIIAILACIERSLKSIGYDVELGRALATFQKVTHNEESALL